MLLPALLLLTSGLVSAEGIQKRAVVSAPSAPSSEPYALSPSSNTLTLTRRKSAKGYNPRSAAYLLYNHPSSEGISPSTHNTGLVALEIGEEFATNITFGTQTFVSIVDTGSSDTWIAESGFQCVNISTDAALPEADCAFGPTFTLDSTFTQIPDENFNITYGSGEFLTGIVGYEDVTIAGIQVRQEVALVNSAAWEGDGTTSGLTGFAYPALTSAYEGTNPSQDSVQEEYSPLFKTIYTQNLTAPLFSLAILRDISGPSGYLSLGGTPPVDFVDDFTSTPILITTITGYPKTYDFYTIDVESVQLGHESLAGGKYIVDSGTTLNYMPTSIADAINKAFSPPAVYNADEGANIVDCNAKAPSLGITISGTVFYTNPLDMILLAGTDANGNDVCISGIVDGGDDASEDVYILGDVFQKNVVTVFDIGATQLRFAAREFYASNDPY